MTLRKTSTRAALVLTVLTALIVPGGVEARSIEHAWAANGSAPRLTVNEARRVIRREVYRRARNRGDYIDRFEIPWCKRRSQTHVGCRFRMTLDDSSLLFSSFCVGGAGVRRDSAGYQVRLWQDCSVDED